MKMLGKRKRLKEIVKKLYFSSPIIPLPSNYQGSQLLDAPLSDLENLIFYSPSEGKEHFTRELKNLFDPENLSPKTSLKKLEKIAWATLKEMPKELEATLNTLYLLSTFEVNSFKDPVKTVEVIASCIFQGKNITDEQLREEISMCLKEHLRVLYNAELIEEETINEIYELWHKKQQKKIEELNKLGQEILEKYLPEDIRNIL